MSPVTVRTARRQDACKILEIMSGAYGARGYCSQSGAEQYLDDNKYAYALVAEKNGDIVGTMLVTYDEGNIPVDEYFPKEMRTMRSTATRMAYYGSFAVKAGMWRIGIFSIGLSLICEAIRRANEDEIEAAIIIVNPRHVSFYESLGFEAIARREEMPGLGLEGKVPGVLMVVTRQTFRGGFVRQKDDLRVYRTPRVASSQLIYV